MVMSVQTVDFFTKGFAHFNDQTCFQFLEPLLPKLQWEKQNNGAKYYRSCNNNSDITEQLSKTHIFLSEKYVSQFWPKYKIGYNAIWNGIDIGADNFHNDLDQGCNLLFLLYFNDTNKDIGGGISFRDSFSKEITGFIHPKKYDIVMVSQQKQWEHSAESMKKDFTRIVANFGFYCERL